MERRTYDHLALRAEKKIYSALNKDGTILSEIRTNSIFK